MIHGGKEMTEKTFRLVFIRPLALSDVVTLTGSNFGKGTTVQTIVRCSECNAEHSRTSAYQNRGFDTILHNHVTYLNGLGWGVRIGSQKVICPTHREPTPPKISK